MQAVIKNSELTSFRLELLIVRYRTALLTAGKKASQTVFIICIVTIQMSLRGVKKTGWLT